VRGVPDIIFFLFVPIALDQGIEFLRSRALCDNPVSPWQGNEFNVCAAAKMPLSTSPEWVHEGYGFTLAVVAFSVVFGAFAANVLYGAMNAVPRAQLETAEAYGMSQRQVNRRVLIPQMWTYALPGLSNLWMILIKATPLLFLLGIQDIVYWARDLGGAKTQAFSYPHPDWRRRAPASDRSRGPVFAEVRPLPGDDDVLRFWVHERPVVLEIEPLRDAVHAINEPLGVIAAFDGVRHLLHLDLVHREHVDGHARRGHQSLVAAFVRALEVLGALVLLQDFLVVELAVAVETPRQLRALLLPAHVRARRRCPPDDQPRQSLNDRTIL